MPAADLLHQRVRRGRSPGAALVLVDRRDVAEHRLYRLPRRLDTVPSQPLPFRPTHLLTLGTDYDWGGLGVGADFRFMSHYERVELYAPTDPLVSPKVLDLRASLARFRPGLAAVIWLTE